MCLLSFLKLGFHWTFPRDCTVGTSLGGTTRGILEGFSGWVMSIIILFYNLLLIMLRLLVPGGSPDLE